MVNVSVKIKWQCRENLKEKKEKFKTKTKK
jgi:hypothetical protein